MIYKETEHEHLKIWMIYKETEHGQMDQIIDLCPLG